MKANKFLFLVLILLAGSFALSAAIPAIERQALIALYNATSGDSWNDKGGWKTPPLDTDGFAMPGTEGTWKGVTVKADHVTIVNLYSNNLRGTIPTELGSLGNLEYLDLTSNQLSGSIPAQLGSLSNLKKLYLDFNQLTGTIPTELGNLSNLQGLYLGVNRLSGTIPTELGNLSNLYSLYLFSNQLSGTIPTELGNLSNLNTLKIAGNRLTGTIPTEIGNLSNLKGLSLMGNQLAGTIPTELGNLSNLQNLSLDSNQLTGTIPTQLGNLSNLQSLHLRSNKLTGPIPTELGSLSNLLSLGLDSNQLTGPIPTQLVNLSNLQSLYLGSNQLTGAIPIQLGSLSKLKYLDLGSNQLTGAIPTSLANLTLLSSSYTDIGYNALYTSDAVLITFLNSKDADWAATQTIAPANVAAMPVDSNTIHLTWDAIPYNGDTGGYRVLVGTAPGGSYTFFQQTANKSITSLSVTGLYPGTPYYFVIQTRTDASVNNQNTVDSENSLEATATTAGGYTISGTIRVGGSPLAGVVMSGLTGNPVTNASGFYTAMVRYNWSGTVTPTLADYSFSPANRVYTNVIVNQTAQDYTATPMLLEVTSPNGGEQWKVGSRQKITWKSTGSIAYVRIEYSTDKSLTWNEIVSATPNKGSFTWELVANTPSANCLVRISDTKARKVNDISNTPFTIVYADPFIRADRTFGDVNVGSLMEIRWDSSGWIPNVRIDYSTDGGSTWRTPAIADSIPNSRKYDWIVPNTVSSNCRVRVSAVGFPGVEGISDHIQIFPGYQPQKGFPDFDNNGICDIVWRDYSKGLNSAWLMNGDGTIKEIIELPIMDDPTWKIAGVNDVNRVGLPDLFWRYHREGVEQGLNQLWFMNSEGTIRWSHEFQLEPVKDLRISGIGDFDRDGRPDYFWRHYTTGENGIFLMSTEFEIKSKFELPMETDLNWRMCGVGDFDGDNLLDILWHYDQETRNKIWLMNADGQIKETRTLMSTDDPNWKVGGVGDVNGDKIQDIIWRNYQTGKNMAWIMNADATVNWTMILPFEPNLNMFMVNSGESGSRD